MPFALHCPGCGVLLKAPDAAAGKTLLCPACKTPNTFPDRPPAPVVASPPPAPTRTAPAAATAVQSPPFIPRMELDEEPSAKDKRETVRDLDEVEDAPLKEEEEDIYKHFEVVQPKGGADEPEEVLPVSAEEDVDELEEVPEEGVEELEEVEEDLVRADLGWSRLLRLSVVHVRRLPDRSDGRDLCDPRARKVLADAREVRVLVGRDAGTIRLEICEGRNARLLATVQRSLRVLPGAGRSLLEIIDGEGHVVGLFERGTWDTLPEAPRFVRSPTGKKLLKVVPEPRHCRVVFTLLSGYDLGEMITEAKYEDRGKGRWFTRGSGCYLRWWPAAEDRPHEKLLSLAVTLGLEL